MPCLSSSRMTSSPADGLLVVLFVTMPVMSAANIAPHESSRNTVGSNMRRFSDLLNVNDFISGGLVYLSRQARGRLHLRGPRASQRNQLQEIFPPCIRNSG